jgi:small conductance mechanosensitive channel
MMYHSSVPRVLAALVILAAVLAVPPGAAQQQEQQQQKDSGDGSKLVGQAERLLEQVDQRKKDVAEWQKLHDSAAGDERLAINLELTEKKLEMLADVQALADNVLQQEAEGLDATAFRKRLEPLILELPGLIRQHLENAQKQASDLRALREETAPEDLLGLEQRIAREDERVRGILGIYFDQVQLMEALGLDASSDKKRLAAAAAKYGDLASQRVELTLRRQGEVREQLAAKPDDAATKAVEAAIQKRLDTNVDDLRAAVKLKQGLGLDTVTEQQLLVRTSGELRDILDSKVAAGVFRQLLSRTKASLIENLPWLLSKVAFFLLILVVFRILSRLARRLTVRALASSKVQTTKLLEQTVTSMVHRVVMLLGVLVALSQIGISMGPLLAGFGVAGIVIGFALQDTLSNFASGVMILFYRPFDVDDLIEVAGISGKVSRMTLVSTTILTLDHQTLIVPNTRIWGDVIRNVTAQNLRRVDMTFGISYHDDIPKAERVLNEIVKGHAKVLADPEPLVRLHKLGESSVDFAVRPWVATDDYWDVYWDVTREVKMRFDREGIRIPFPQRDVHIRSEKAAAA